MFSFGVNLVDNDVGVGLVGNPDKIAVNSVVD
jgi:hypothetical protein